MFLMFLKFWQFEKKIGFKKINNDSEKMLFV